MKNYPLPGVTVKKVTSVSNVTAPCYEGADFTAGQTGFRLQVSEVGVFYAAAGNMVEYSPEQGADHDWVNLYLNGQVLVALLHQRGIISFHASSFLYGGTGIMVLGESGAGKSSLTASFSLDGAGFLTDDVTPVFLQDLRPVIWPLHNSIRIRKNTAEQLNVKPELLRDAEAGTGKHYVDIGRAGEGVFPLDVIMTIGVDNVQSPVFDEPPAAHRFSLLRGEICMSEMLAGMPATESNYIIQLTKIIEGVRFVRLVRPPDIRITELHSAVEEYLKAMKR